MDANQTWLQKWAADNTAKQLCVGTARYALNPTALKRLVARDAAALELAEAVVEALSGHGTWSRVSYRLKQLKAVVEGEK